MCKEQFQWRLGGGESWGGWALVDLVQAEAGTAKLAGKADIQSHRAAQHRHPDDRKQLVSILQKTGVREEHDAWPGPPAWCVGSVQYERRSAKELEWGAGTGGAVARGVPRTV